MQNLQDLKLNSLTSAINVNQRLGFMNANDIDFVSSDHGSPYLLNFKFFSFRIDGYFLRPTMHSRTRVIRFLQPRWRSLLIINWRPQLPKNTERFGNFAALSMHNATEAAL
jgi:hypothetical protein